MENLIKNKTGENNMTLTLTNLTKQYGNFTALENFTYDFTAGVYGLLGTERCRQIHPYEYHHRQSETNFRLGEI